jgi:hypothetical protein
MFGLAEFYHGQSNSASARSFAPPTLRENEEKIPRVRKIIISFTFP